MKNSAEIPEMEQMIGEMAYDHPDKQRLIQEYINSLLPDQKVILVYGFPSEDDRERGDLTNTVLFAPVTKCRSLRRQMQLDCHATGYIWKDYYNGHTNESVGNYDDAFNLL